MLASLPNDKLFFDEQLLQHIRQNNNDEVRAILINNDVLCKASDVKGATLLHYTSQYGNAELTQYLINFGLNVNAQDKFGRTALLFAVTRIQAEFSMETINILLEANADIFIADLSGKYPLEHVVDSLRFNKLVIVRNFFKKLKEYCQNDDTMMADLLMKANCPLERAIYLQNSKVTEMMIKSGCPIDARHPRTDHTALHMAAKFMDVENVKVLIKCGANVTARIHDRMLPLTVYLITSIRQPHQQNSEIMKLLMSEYFTAADKTGDTVLSLRHILQIGDEEAVRYMLQYDVDLSVRSSNGNTVTHYLALNSHPNVARPFESKISDVNVRNQEGCTPLHYAAVAHNLGTVQLLLDRGASVHEKSHVGNTPLSAIFFTLSVRRHHYEDREANQKKVVELLLQHGADVQVIFSNEQETMFDVVIRTERFDLGEPLVAKLVFLEKLGEPIIDLIRKKIDSHPKLKDHYDICKRQLEEMEKIVIYESINLFKLLTQSEKEIIRRYAYIQELIDEFENFNVTYSFNSYYYDILRARITSTLPKLKLIRDATRIIFDLLAPQRNKICLVVVRHIIDYLDYEDMKVLRDIMN